MSDDGFVLTLLRNKRSQLIALAQRGALEGIDGAARAVYEATEDLDRAIGLLEAAASTKQRKPADPAAPKKRGRRSKVQLPRGESDDVFAQGGIVADGTITPFAEAGP